MEGAHISLELEAPRFMALLAMRFAQAVIAAINICSAISTGGVSRLSGLKLRKSSSQVAGSKNPSMAMEGRSGDAET